MSDTVKVNKEALEELADYVADDIRHHGGPEMAELEDAVRDAYEALEE